MSKNNIFDFLENSEEAELEMIDRLTPDFSNEQFERILKMSKRKRNKMKESKERNIKVNSNNGGTVSGVEVYKRPAWIRPLLTAASLVILTCGIAFGFHLMRPSDSPAPVIEPNMPSTTETTAVTSDVTTTATTTTTTQPSQDTTDTSVDEADYKAECENAMNEIKRKNHEAIELIANISDHLDMNDTITVDVRDEYCDPGTEPIINDYKVTYARYINPKFGSLDEIRDFYIEYAVKYTCGPDWEYTGLDMDSHYVKRYFDTRVQPGETIKINTWDKYDTIPLYTEYNGKIYKLVADAPTVAQTDAEYWEEVNNSPCHEVLGDYSADYFEIYRIYYFPDSPDGGYGNIVPVKKENGKWVIYNSLAKEMPEELWRELCEEYESKQQ